MYCRFKSVTRWDVYSTQRWRINDALRLLRSCTRNASASTVNVPCKYVRPLLDPLSLKTVTKVKAIKDRFCQAIGKLYPSTSRWTVLFSDSTDKLRTVIFLLLSKKGLKAVYAIEYSEHIHSSVNTIAHRPSRDSETSTEILILLTMHHTGPPPQPSLDLSSSRPVRNPSPTENA